MTLADRIVVFNEGRIEQVGSPMALYERPANRFVAGFIGAPAMNFLAPGCALLAGLAVPAGAQEAGIRPEHLALVALGDGTDGTVELIERLGPETFAHLRLPGIPDTLTLRLPGDSMVTPGAKVGLRAMPDRVIWLDAAGQALAG